MSKSDRNVGVWKGQRCLSAGLRAVVLWACLAGPAARAQQVLVRANVADDTTTNAFGPNRRCFGHLFVGYGLVAGPAGPGAGLRYGPASAELRGGGRLKLRLSQALAANLDLSYAYLRFELAQNDRKTLPAPGLHRRESLALHQLGADLSLRLNAGRRGNVVGRYLDLLAGGAWAAGTAHATEDDPAPGVGAVATTERGLPYLRRWSGGVGARLGIDRYALVGRCRLSDALRPVVGGGPELPRWVLGLEVGLF